MEELKKHAASLEGLVAQQNYTITNLVAELCSFRQWASAPSLPDFPGGASVSLPSSGDAGACYPSFAGSVPAELNVLNGQVSGISNALSMLTTSLPDAVESSIARRLPVHTANLVTLDAFKAQVSDTSAVLLQLGEAMDAKIAELQNSLAATVRGVNDALASALRRYDSLIQRQNGNVGIAQDASTNIKRPHLPSVTVVSPYTWSTSMCSRLPLMPNRLAQFAPPWVVVTSSANSSVMTKSGCTV
jgi:hypothetical protein